MDALRLFSCDAHSTVCFSAPCCAESQSSNIIQENNHETLDHSFRHRHRPTAVSAAPRAPVVWTAV